MEGKFSKKEEGDVAVKFFENIIVGIKILGSYLKEHFSISNLIIFILLTITLIISLSLIIEKIQKSLFKQKLRITRNQTTLSKILVRYLSKSSFLNSILNRVAYKIAIFNKDSVEKNREYTIVLLLVIIFFAIVSGLVIIPNDTFVWYMSLFYICILIIFISLVIYGMNMAARMSFSKKLPKTYKVINSRLIYTENILEAINLSRDDFDKSIAREMTRIHDCLRKNTRKRAEETFEFLESMYNNRYFTILLNLIYQAHYKGVSRELKKQFEDTKEDILTELEDQKDLDFVAKIYIFLSIIFPFAIQFIENFNRMGLGERADIFYSTPRGMMFKLAILVCIVVQASIMLLLARNV